MTLRLGSYTTFRRLASGGMGEIFLATLRGPSGFEKVVVVKRILPHFASDADFVSMFLNEARLAATLSHPNIIQVFDAGKTEDSYYFAMEYLHGADLGQILRAAAAKKAAIPLEHVLTIIMAAAAGLHHAHIAQGADGTPRQIIHRDVSPSNVMVTDEGGIKILDFGIAKALAATNVTREGTRKGKVSYMSPEQCLGVPLDARSDIFALGILLYEASMMRRLFRGDNEFATMNMITSGQVPLPTNVRADYPVELERIVLKALTIDRNSRYATALEMHDDLERFAAEQGLRSSAPAAGRYVRELFGERPYPAPEADDAPTTVSVAHEDLPLVTAIPDLFGTPAPSAASSVEEPKSAGRRPFARWGRTMLGVGGLAIALALQQLMRDTPVAEVAPGSDRETDPVTPAPTPEPAPAEPATSASAPEPAQTGGSTDRPNSPAKKLGPVVTKATPTRRTFEAVMQKASTSIGSCLRRRGMIDGDSISFDVHVAGKTGRIRAATPRGLHRSRANLGECVVKAATESEVSPAPARDTVKPYEIVL